MLKTKPLVSLLEVRISIWSPYKKKYVFLTLNIPVFTRVANKQTPVACTNQFHTSTHHVLES